MSAATGISSLEKQQKCKLRTWNKLNNYSTSLEHYHQHFVATDFAPYLSSPRQNANDCASRSSRVYSTGTVVNLSPAPRHANSVTSPTTLSVRSANSPPLPELSHVLSLLRIHVRYLRTSITTEADMHRAKLPAFRKPDRSIHPINEPCYGQLNPAYTFTP